MNQSTYASGSALVASFATSQAARDAVDALHHEGFHDTWIGITRGVEGGHGLTATGGATVVESENAVARFFGAGDSSLHDALVKHGVSETEAARLDGTLPIDSAILTVDGSNHPELAAQVVSSNGGRIVTSAGSTQLYDAYADESGTTGALSGDRLSTLGGYRSGEALDEPRRIALREERLAIGKRTEQTGEAEISKKVVTERTSVDVPVYHEELYIERRPASGAYDDAGVIGDSETIRIPLQKETAVVDKATVVTGEVAVGQRRIEGTEHVSEELKKEELKIDGADVNLAR